MTSLALKNVAVVGAGGQIGGYIIKALLDQGKHDVTAITRPDSTSRMPQGLSAVRKADYGSHTALVEALRGQDILVISLNSVQGVPQQKKLVDAAVEAGVRYIVPNEYANDRTKTSLAKDTIIGQLQIEMRSYIEQVGKVQTHWIAISCGFWYEYSLGGSAERYGFDILNRRAVFFDDGTTKITTTTREQCARAVARLLALPVTTSDRSPCLSDWNDKALHIGDFTVSQRDMLDSIQRVTGTRESDWTVTHERSQVRYHDAFSRVQNGDLSAFEIMLYSRTFFPDDPGEFQKKLQNGLLGLPEIELDEATASAVRIAEENSGAHNAKPAA